VLVPSLQCAGFALIILYLTYWRVRQSQLSTESWESLHANLIETSSDENPLWAKYRRGGILLRIADYADRHSVMVDPAMIAQLRSDALRIRLGALLALMRFFSTPPPPVH
jgi:hypothetical protein